MITRIVKLTISPEKQKEFISLFKTNKPHIINFEGCEGVILLQSAKYKNVFFTYSHWQSEEALNEYRKSELFAKVWKNTKSKFCAQPQAWTTTEIA